MPRGKRKKVPMSMELAKDTGTLSKQVIALEMEIRHLTDQVAGVESQFIVQENLKGEIDVQFKCVPHECIREGLDQNRASMMLNQALIRRMNDHIDDLERKLDAMNVSYGELAEDFYTHRGKVLAHVLGVKKEWKKHR
jgi:hypothetical protein